MEPLIPLFIQLVWILGVFVYFLITTAKDKKKDSRYRHRHRIRYD
jgi:hypothetical protein